MVVIVSFALLCLLSAGPCLDRHSSRHHSGLAESDDCRSRIVEGRDRRRSIGWSGGRLRGRRHRRHLLAAATALFHFQKNPGPWAGRCQIPGGRRHLGRRRGASVASAGCCADRACLRRRHAIGRAAIDAVRPRSRSDRFWRSACCSRQPFNNTGRAAERAADQRPARFGRGSDVTDSSFPTVRRRRTDARSRPVPDRARRLCRRRAAAMQG